MTDLTNLPPAELLEAFRASAFGVNEWAEIFRRLERLERCEAQLAREKAQVLEINEWKNQADNERIAAQKRLEKCEAALKQIYQIATRSLAEPLNESTAYVVDICTIVETLDMAIVDAASAAVEEK